MAAHAVSRPRQTPEIIEGWFKLRENATNVSTEIIGGVTITKSNVVPCALPSGAAVSFGQRWGARADRPPRLVRDFFLSVSARSS